MHETAGSGTFPVFILVKFVSRFSRSSWVEHSAWTKTTPGAFRPVSGLIMMWCIGEKGPGNNFFIFSGLDLNELQSNLSLRLPDKNDHLKIADTNFSHFNSRIQTCWVRSWKCDHPRNANYGHRRSAQNVDSTCKKWTHVAMRSRSSFHLLVYGLLDKSLRISVLNHDILDMVEFLLE